jgi:hypothetical protein
MPYNMATCSQKRHSCCVDSKICRTQWTFHVTKMKDTGCTQFGVETSWKMVTWNTDKQEEEWNLIRITSNGGIKPSHSTTTENTSSYMILGQKYKTAFV